MYVSLLARELFPVVLQKYFPSPTMKHTAAACRIRGVIAEVTVRTDLPIYPCRVRRNASTEKGLVNHEWRFFKHTWGERVVYPVGTFRTILAGPELRTAFHLGHVVAVYRSACYRLAPAFESFGKELLELRRAAREQKRQVTEDVCKLTGNSLAGKLASRGGGWHNDKKAKARKRWGTWVESDMSEAVPKQFRALAGIVQQYHQGGEGPRAVPAVLAYLTSYGRQLLWSILATAGIHNVIWCDTDGLIVTPEGRDRIVASSHYADDEPGKLRLVNEVRSFRAWTPKHYYADGQLVLGGFRTGAWFDTSGEIRDWRSLSVDGVMSDPTSGTGRHTLRRSDPLTMPFDGPTDANGQGMPIRLHGGEAHGERGETMI
jgi:hypothetical protein